MFPNSSNEPSDQLLSEYVRDALGKSQVRSTFRVRLKTLEISEKRIFFTLWAVTWKRRDILGWIIKGQMILCLGDQTPVWQKLATGQF